MSVLSPPFPILGLFVVAWAQFAFVSACGNPFVRPRLPLLRRRWRHGRRMGTAALLGGACALSALALPSVPTSVALGIGACVYAIIGVPSMIVFHVCDRSWWSGTKAGRAGAATDAPRVPAVPQSVPEPVPQSVPGPVPEPPLLKPGPLLEPTPGPVPKPEGRREAEAARRLRRPVDIVV